MRGFFFLLLLTNVSFIAWQYFNDRGKSESVDIYSGIAMVSNGLTLISELPEDRRPPLRETENPEVPTEPGSEESKATTNSTREEPTPSPEPVKPDANVVKTAEAKCYRVENIESKAERNDLLSWLRTNSASDIEHAEKQVKEENYWVILPPYSNRKKANEAAEILTKHRIKDFFIVRTGEHENAISLGVYSTLERAKRRYKQVDVLKARLRKPSIETLEVPETRYEVRFKLDKGRQAEKLAAYLKKAHMPEAEETSCK
jgi:hypothetical protein